MMKNISVQLVPQQPVAQPPPCDVRSELAAQYRRLLTYARTLTGDESAAEDLAQDTLERALRASDRFQAGSNAGAWLTRILKNRFMDRYRHRVAIREVGIECATALAIAEPPRAPTALDFVTEQDVIVAMGRLSAILKETFRLRYVDGWSYEKIAGHFGVPPSTVGTRLRRARLALRRLIMKGLTAGAKAAVISFPTVGDDARSDTDRPSSQGLVVLGARRGGARSGRVVEPRTDLSGRGGPRPPGRDVRRAVHGYPRAAQGGEHRP
jgi:RNA polymerase sigma-70 factor (ECF subfamily)